jgi:hypothetical protein
VGEKNLFCLVCKARPGFVGDFEIEEKRLVRIFAWDTKQASAKRDVRVLLIAVKYLSMRARGGG